MDTPLKKIGLFIVALPIACFCITPPRPSFIECRLLDSNFKNIKTHVVINIDSVEANIDSTAVMFFVKNKGSVYNFAYDILKSNALNFEIKEFWLWSVSDSSIVFRFAIPAKIKAQNKIKGEYAKISLKRQYVAGVWCYPSKQKKVIAWSIFVIYNAVFLSLLAFLIYTKAGD